MLDLTTKNKNKITENKIVITNKMDEINNQMTNTMGNHIDELKIEQIQTYKKTAKTNKKKKRHK